MKKILSYVIGAVFVIGIVYAAETIVNDESDTFEVAWDRTQVMFNELYTGLGLKSDIDSPTFTTKITTPLVEIPQTASPAEQEFVEGSGDGTDKHTLRAQAFSADRVSLLPDYVIGFLNLGVISATGEILVNTLGTFTAPITANPYAFTAANLYNSTLWYGATGEIDLDPGVDGMAAIVYNTGAFTITIDPNASEVIVRDGTAQTGGVSITLSTGAGNFVALVFNGTQWVTMGFKGTLGAGS